MAGLSFAHPEQDKLSDAFAAILGETSAEFGGLRINSGYRSPAYNRKVNGAKRSFHMTGNAADIDMSGMDDSARTKLVRSLQSKGANGFITYSDQPDMLHVDMRPGAPHFMHDKTAKKIGEAPKWFRAVAGGEVPEQGGGMANLVGGATRDQMERRKKVTDPALLDRLNGTGPTRKRVTDPSILRELNGGSGAPVASGRKRVTDPALLRQLNGETPPSRQYQDTADELSRVTRSFDQQPEVNIRGEQSANVRTAAQPGDERYGDALDVGIGQGVLMGAGDELGAAAAVPRRMWGQYREGRPVSIGDAYDEGLDIERDRVRNFRERNPVGSTVAELGGGLASAVVAAPASGFGFGGRVFNSMATGAGYGGAYGFASGEGGLGNRANNAITGAVTGAGIGAAVPAATGAVSKGYNTLMNVTARPAMNAIRSTVNPAGNAMTLTNRALARDSVAPEQASARLQGAIDAGDDSMMLMDVAGDNTRRLARFATNMPGKGSNMIREAVEDRQLAQPERVIDAVRKGLDDPARYFGTIDDIIEKRQTASRPLYEEAYKRPVPYTEKLESLLGRGKVMRTALSRAEDMAAAEGIPFRQFFARVADDGSYTVQRVPDTRAWDLIKRSLDDVIQGETEFLPNGAEKLTNMGRIVSNIRRELVAELDRLNPTYAKARKVYSSSSESLDVVTKGGKLLDADPELARRTLRDMSEDDRQLARLGLSKAMVDRVQRMKDGANTVRAIFASPKHRAVLKEAFPSEKAFAEFKEAMQREAEKTKTRAEVKGNSTSVAQAIDGLDNQTDSGVVGSLLQMKPMQAAGAAIQKALARATVVNEATAKELARILTSSDPQVSKQILGQMQQMALRDARVARNLMRVQDMLRGGAVMTGTRTGTDALRERTAPPRMPAPRQPLEITVGRPRP